MIYRIAGEDASVCRKLMEELSSGGSYTITEKMREALVDFYANYCTEEETAETIHHVYKESGYILDTHSGCLRCI